MNLIQASNRGDLKLVKELAESGADIHIRNNEALRWASGNGHLVIVEYLKHVVLLRDRKRKILEHLG